MPRHEIALKIDSIIRESYYYGYLTDNYINFITYGTLLLMLILLRCGPRKRAFFLLPILAGVMFILRNLMESMYYLYMYTMYFTGILIIIKPFVVKKTQYVFVWFSTETICRPRNEKIIKALYVSAILYFIWMIAYTQILFREPLTLFVKIHDVPPKLCPATNSTYYSAMQSQTHFTSSFLASKYIDGTYQFSKNNYDYDYQHPQLDIPFQPNFSDPSFWQLENNNEYWIDNNGKETYYHQYQSKLTDYSLKTKHEHSFVSSYQNFTSMWRDGVLYAEPFASYMLNYLDMHEKTSTMNSQQRKFVVFRATNDGLGNRIQGMISTFLLALLTNRTFVVSWSSQKMSPSALSSLFQKPGFEWNYNIMSRYMNHSSKLSRWVPYCRVCGARRPPDEHSVYQGLLCDENFGFDPNTQVWEIRSTLWYAPVLTHNPYYKEKICQIFGDLPIYETLARALLHPAPPLMEKIESFYNEYFAGHQVIGLQIRRKESANSITEDQEEVFWRCAQQLSINDDTRWFLVTDDTAAREKLQQHLGDRLIYYNSEITRWTSSGIQHALIDNWLLGECDEIISSPYSTFGYIGHARTSKYPYQVHQNKQCVKQLYSEPCFQYWFGMMELPCWNNSFLTSDVVNQENCHV